MSRPQPQGKTTLPVKEGHISRLGVCSTSLAGHGAKDADPIAEQPDHSGMPGARRQIAGSLSRGASVHHEPPAAEQRPRLLNHLRRRRPRVREGVLQSGLRPLLPAHLVEREYLDTPDRGE